jgi:hypothetical protein
VEIIGEIVTDRSDGPARVRQKGETLVERFDDTITLQYLARLSPEHVTAARDYLGKLPAGWYLLAPRPCHRSDGSFSKQAVTHALLFILDSDRFPGSTRTRLLARFMAEIHEMNRNPVTHPSPPLGRGIEGEGSITDDVTSPHQNHAT